jgi:molybdopterin molybdotransferase
MLTVRPVAEAIEIIKEHFGKFRTQSEWVTLDAALDRVLAQDIISNEFVPDFNRSTVDGYAVIGSDIFGCSDTIPALLTRIGESFMGRHIDLKVKKGQCVYVPTGGEVPEGADTMIMLEYAEELGDGQVAIYKPAAPGTNMIFRGDDTKPGAVILPASRRINVADTGTLAALGVTEVPVMCQPRVGIITTGDELVLPGEKLELGQIRDVNGPMLMHAVKETGGNPFFWGIIQDDDTAIKAAIQTAIKDCDLLILTGGTSVGEKDAAPRVISELGTMLVHGLASKPGKPTLFGEISGIPVFGLSGNPLAAYFMFYLLLRPLLFNMQGYQPLTHSITLPLERSIPSNHGREEFVPVKIQDEIVHPISSKSGLITTLANTDGFIRIPRDLEGLPQGAMVEVTLFTR